MAKFNFKKVVKDVIKTGKDVATEVASAGLEVGLGAIDTVLDGDDEEEEEFPFDEVDEPKQSSRAPPTNPAFNPQGTQNQTFDPPAQNFDNGNQTFVQSNQTGNDTFQQPGNGSFEQPVQMGNGNVGNFPAAGTGTGTKFQDADGKWRDSVTGQWTDPPGVSSQNLDCFKNCCKKLDKKPPTKRKTCAPKKKKCATPRRRGPSKREKEAEQKLAECMRMLVFMQGQNKGTGDCGCNQKHAQQPQFVPMPGGMPGMGYPGIGMPGMGMPY